MLENETLRRQARIVLLVSFFSLKSLIYIMECTVYSLHFED
jgi:hypothetical protein